MLIREIHHHEKPRERLLKYGAQHLSDYELLAIIIRTGLRNQSALDLANAVLSKYDNLYSLSQTSSEELTTINGIGQTKAVTILASIELGRRMMMSNQIKYGTIFSSKEAGKYFLNEFKGFTQEHVVVAFLNTKHDIIKKKTIFIGSSNQSVAEPRDIFREAVRIGAVKLLVAHNHPSGNPEPSQEDIIFTERLIQAGKIVGIEILDHFIIGDGIYVSLTEKGYI